MNELAPTSTGGVLLSATRNVLMTCAVCRADSTHSIVTSSSGFGIDLDGRWHGSARTDRMRWPLRCPKCGYSFHNLEVTPPEGVVDSEEYRAYADDPALQEDARLWLTTSVVAEALGGAAAASHAALQAAWVMDDAGEATRAIAFRTRAINLMRAAREHDQDDTSRLMLDALEYYIAADDTDAHAIETGVQVF